MIDDPQTLGDEVFASLPAALRDRTDLRELARGLAREYANYSDGIVAMDGGSSEDALGRMLCEDLEVSHLLDDLFVRKADDEETDPPPEEGTEQPPAVPLQVAEIGTGHGFAAIVLAYVYPDVDFEILEPNEKRAWLAKRIVNLLGCRNVKVRGGRLAAWLPTHAEAFDIVLVKHVSPLEAVQNATDFVRPGGLLVDFQTPDAAALASRNQSLGVERGMTVQPPRPFRSEPIDGSALLLLRRPEVAVAGGSST